MRVARIENPIAFGLDDVMELLSWWDPDMTGWNQLVFDVQDGRAAAIVGAREEKLEGFAIVYLPGKDNTQCPQVSFFRCDGGNKLKRAMVREVVDFVKQAGYTKVWAINETDRTDTVWARTFRAAGPSRKIGSIMEFDLRENVNGNAVRQEGVEDRSGGDDSRPDQGSSGGLVERAPKHLQHGRRTDIPRPAGGRDKPKRNKRVGKRKPAANKPRHSAAAKPNHGRKLLARTTGG